MVLQAGDVLYLPALWWHCVEGSRDRNMILSYWFDIHPHKRMQGEEDVEGKVRDANVDLD